MPELSPAAVERGLTRAAGLASSEMDFQLMRSRGAITYGGAAAGEIFHARGQVERNDPTGACCQQAFFQRSLPVVRGNQLL